MDKERREKTVRAQDAEADGIIEGRNAVIEALRAGETIDKIFIQKGETDKTLGHIASTARSRGIVVVDADRRKLDRVRVAFGVAGPTPMRALETERALTGLPLAEAVSLIPSLVRAEIQPRDSQRASRAFRLHIGGVIAQRALIGAIQDGGGAL